MRMPVRPVPTAEISSKRGSLDEALGTRQHDPGGGPVRERRPLLNVPRNHLEELGQVRLINSAEVSGQLQHHESHKAAWLPPRYRQLENNHDAIDENLCVNLLTASRVKSVP